MNYSTKMTVKGRWQETQLEFYRVIRPQGEGATRASDDIGTSRRQKRFLAKMHRKGVNRVKN